MHYRHFAMVSARGKQGTALGVYGPGGFFSPLLLGVFSDAAGVVSAGFIPLSFKAARRSETRNSSKLPGRGS
jgi:hypothetical protein